MSKPYFSVRYVPTRAGLPENLERGRAYFIGDEQVILVDYGNGPITYGNRPGPQGAAGEPQPRLQGQIDELAEASLETTYHLFETNQKLRTKSQTLSQRISDLDSAMQESDNQLRSDLHTHYLMLKELRDLISNMQAEITDLHNVISIVTKILASLYPDSDDDMYPSDEDYAIFHLTQNEIFSCEEGSYRVREAYTDSEGAIVITLDQISDADQALILTLQTGDEIVTSGNERWTVTGYNIENEEGVIVLSYAGSQQLIETLKPGDEAEYNGGSFTVNSVSRGTNGEAVISLTLKPSN